MTGHPTDVAATEDADGVPSPAVADQFDLVAAAAEIDSPSSPDADAARAAVDVRLGGLADLAGWLAAVLGGSSRAPRQGRCLVIGTLGPAAALLCDQLDVRTESIDVGALTVTDAIHLGASTADSAVDAGADLLVVASPLHDAGPAALVGALTEVEPVKLLPRGAAAVDTAAWIERAAYLRDGRRELIWRREDPTALLEQLASPVLGALVGLLVQATARRTAIVLDGSAAMAAGLLARDIEPRAARWWQVADTSSDPVHTRVCADLDLRPILSLGTSTGDGTAGLLAIPVLRIAGELGSVEAVP